MLLFRLPLNKLSYFELKQCAFLCLADSHACKVGAVSIGFVKELLSKIFQKAHLIEPTHISLLLDVIQDHRINIPAYYELLGAAVLRHQSNLTFFEIALLSFRLYNRKLNSAALRHYTVSILDLYFRNIKNGFTVPPEGLLPKHKRVHLLPDYSKLKTDLKQVLQIEASQASADSSEIISSQEVKAVIQLLWSYIVGLNQGPGDLKYYVKVFNQRFCGTYSGIDLSSLNLLHQINEIMKENLIHSVRLNIPNFSEIIPHSSRHPEMVEFVRHFNQFKNEHAFAFNSTKVSRHNGYQFSGETKLAQLIYLNEERSTPKLSDEIRKAHFRKIKPIIELEYEDWRLDKENYFFLKLMG